MDARTDHFVIPELCNTRALALLILFSELLVLVLLFAGGEVSWVRLGLMSLAVQWVALVSAAVLCLLRGFLTKLGVALGTSMAMLTVVLVTTGLGYLNEVVIDRGPGALERILGHVVIAAIITGLVLRYFYVQQRLRVQEQSELQSRIQALQSRIRPHFLFNSMNIIASLIAVDPDTAETVVEDLSELFRASLNEAGNQVSIDDELSLCERYLRIEALRLGDRLELVWDVEPHEDTVMIPLLTLQPLLENAIYHGVQPLPEGGTIAVQVAYNGDKVAVNIRNPLPGDGAAKESEGNRMALKNIRTRLAVLYGNDANLVTEARGDEFVTELNFPKLISATTS